MNQPAQFKQDVYHFFCPRCNKGLSNWKLAYMCCNPETKYKDLRDKLKPLDN